MSFLSTSKTVLLIADEALYVYSSGVKGVRLVEAVPWDVANFESNVAAIVAKDCGGKPVIVINDMVEQHYRKELIQKQGVGLLDKAGLIQQKLAVTFPNYPVRAGYALSEKSPTKEKLPVPADVYIFAAIPASNQYTRTLGAVRESLSSIAGFCLLPVESSSLVKTLVGKLAARRKTKSTWGIFIGQHKNGSARQIVTKNGEMALTRLSPITESDHDPEQWCCDLVQELKATMSYLSRFGYSPEDGLDVVVIANPATGSMLESMVDIDCNLATMTSKEAAKILGLKIAAQDDLRHADILHAAWASQKARPTLALSSAGIEEVVKPRQMAALALVGLILSGAYLGYSLLTSLQSVAAMGGKLSDARKEEARLEAVYQSEVQQKESLGFDVELIRGSLRIYEQLQNLEFDVLPVIAALSRTIDPNMHLDNMTVRRYQEFKALDERANQAGRNRRDKDDKGPGEKIYDIRLQMTYPSTMDVDEGNAQVEEFKDKLQALLPSYNVRVAKFLKDYAYTQQVVMETGDVPSSGDLSDFVVELLIEKFRLP